MLQTSQEWMYSDFKIVSSGVNQYAILFLSLKIGFIPQKFKSLHKLCSGHALIGIEMNTNVGDTIPIR